jgi:hypothetical protein
VYESPPVEAVSEPIKIAKTVLPVEDPVLGTIKVTAA